MLGSSVPNHRLPKEAYFILFTELATSCPKTLPSPHICLSFSLYLAFSSQSLYLLLIPNPPIAIVSGIAVNT